MSVEYDVVNYLQSHPFSTTSKIAKAISQPRVKVIYVVARLMWQQRIELSDYTCATAEGRQHPRYIVKPVSRGGIHV
ncbi:MAG TPA: hypothetical protein ENK06_13105 [Gammaproteobacteria bacterium]|nr:hypothetical protein [Gammaproteobacteria bacterium]